MLIEILKRTPVWVFALFFILLAVGYLQSKNRTVSRGRISILPLAMIGLSCYCVLSAFGIEATGLACWGLGVAMAVAFGIGTGNPRNVVFNRETQSFHIPGSAFPLILMMAIFFTKYAVGIVLARHLPLASTTFFVNTISLVYGLLSGLFLARAMVIWRAARHHSIRAVQSS